MLCIPEHVALQLKLETESMREVSPADGRSMTVPYDLVVSPSRREITLDPSSPNIPHARAKATGGRLWRCASNDRRAGHI
jgi:hypothetical protein